MYANKSSSCILQLHNGKKKGGLALQYSFPVVCYLRMLETELQYHIWIMLLDI